MFDDEKIFDLNLFNMQPDYISEIIIFYLYQKNDRFHYCEFCDKQFLSSHCYNCTLQSLEKKDEENKIKGMTITYQLRGDLEYFHRTIAHHKGCPVYGFYYVFDPIDILLFKDEWNLLGSSPKGHYYVKNICSPRYAKHDKIILKNTVLSLHIYPLLYRVISYNRGL
jgi:hypothetical protein